MALSCKGALSDSGKGTYMSDWVREHMSLIGWGKIDDWLGRGVREHTLLIEWGSKGTYMINWVREHTSLIGSGSKGTYMIDWVGQIEREIQTHMMSVYIYVPIHIYLYLSPYPPDPINHVCSLTPHKRPPKIVQLSCKRALKTVALSHTTNHIKRASFPPKSPTKMALFCKRNHYNTRPLQDCSNTRREIALAMEANVSNLTGRRAH